MSVPTPVTEGASYSGVWRSLYIPYGYAPAVMGALSELLLPSHWAVIDGDTVEEAITKMEQMYFCPVTFAPPYGLVQAFAGALPPGWLECDGATYSAADYPELYGVLDPAYHLPGDMFKTPDLRGRVVVSAADSPMTPTLLVGDSGGAYKVTLTTAELPPHAHGYQQAVISDIDLEDIGVPQPAIALTTPSLTDSTGEGQGHENMPPFHVLRYGIFAFMPTVT